MTISDITTGSVGCGSAGGRVAVPLTRRIDPPLFDLTCSRKEPGFPGPLEKGVTLIEEGCPDLILHKTRAVKMAFMKNLLSWKDHSSVALGLYQQRAFCVKEAYPSRWGAGLAQPREKHRKETEPEHS